LSVGAKIGLSVFLLSMKGLKSAREETCTLYCFVPVFASQLRTSLFTPTSEAGFVGS
jgi:hypothetical protein